MRGRLMAALLLAVSLVVAAPHVGAQPKTTITLPFEISRAVSSAARSAFGVCAKSTMIVKGCPRLMRSMRPGTAGTRRTPFCITSIGMPCEQPTLNVAKMFETL